jgi:hypothetical protein
MSPIVLVRSSQEASFVPLADVKATLGIASSDATHDATLSRMIAGVASAFAQELGRKSLLRQRYQEGIAGRGRTRILLSERPVDSGTVSVTLDGDAVTDYTFEPSGTLYRSDGWDFGDRAGGQDPERNISGTYYGGFLLASESSTFVAATAYTKGAFVVPPDLTASRFYFEVTTAGTAGTEPTWPTTAAGTVTSGTVTFTARDAEILPSAITELAIATLVHKFQTRDIPAGMSGWSEEGLSENYSTRMFEGNGLPSFVTRGLRNVRWD